MLRNPIEYLEIIIVVSLFLSERKLSVMFEHGLKGKNALIIL